MYKIALQKDKLNRNKTTAIHIIAAIVLIVSGFLTLITPFSLQIFMAGKSEMQDKIPVMNWINYSGALLILIGLYIINSLFFFTKKSITSSRNLLLRVLEIGAFFAILIVSIIYNYHLSAVYSGIMLILMAIIYYVEKVQLQQNKMLYIDDLGIKIQSGIKDTHWNWQQIKKVILKKSVFTVILKNNNTYQLLINEKQKDEELINKYTQGKIAEFIHLNIENDW